MSAKVRPPATLLIAPGCAHCTAVREALDSLAREGVLGSLEVINIAEEPERTAGLGVRSVPWVRIGEFEFSGAHTRAEYRHWSLQAASPDGMREYLQSLLTTGRLHRVETMVHASPRRLRFLVQILGDANIELQARLGAGAVFESLSESPPLRELVQELGTLTLHPDARVRADGCHFLSLTGNHDAIAYLERCCEDADADVREIAGESLARLGQPERR